MRLPSLAVLVSLLALAACEAPRPGAQGDPEALALLERARAAHGSDRLGAAEVTFSFRGTPFVLRRDAGWFRYARTITDEQGRTVEEVVDNDGVHRFIGGEEAPLAADEAGRLATAVNSVAYFALLPAPLDDPAVRARALAPDTVASTVLDRVEVTFVEAGGGADFEDRYVYWLRRDDGRIDRYAYTYAPTPGDTARTETGTRFRIPLGATEAGGVVFQDWINLTADSVGALDRFAEAHAAGETFEVSRVVLDSVRVRPL
ncbi:MAG: DUF6503 family protein [Bacteroidota bacterium]